MEKVIRITGAIGLGAYIGTVIALNIHRHFWWVGVILGGIIGWVSYGFREIPETFRRLWKRNREVDWRTCRFAFALVFTGVALALGIVAGIDALSICIGEPHSSLLGPYHFHIYIIGTLWMTIISFSMVEREDLLSRDVSDVFEHNQYPFLLFFTPGMLPIVVGLGLIVLMGWGSIWITREIAWPVIKTTVKTLQTVHSNARLLCSIYAAIGATIGSWTGIPTHGAVAGIMIGLTHHFIDLHRVRVGVRSK